MKNTPLLLGISCIALLCLAALAAPLITHYDPAHVDSSSLLLAPDARHWLGTDSLGRDLFSRMLYGARISLLVGFLAMGVATVLGVGLGALAGFYGKTADTIIMRFVDIMLCFPTIFLLLAAAALLEPSVFTLIVIIGATSWMGTCRLVRSEILSLKEREFILAAHAAGASDWRIITRHLLPNCLGPVMVNATLNVASAILIESSLSFLGLGVQPPTPSWGNILIESKSTMTVAWWLTVYPGAAIALTIASFNLLGEGLKRLFGHAPLS
jgi:peptide/nickel transport system permease protein